MADNKRAIALYRSAGFVDVGVVPGRGAYPGGARKDNLFMFRRVDGTLSKEPGQGHFREDLGGGVTLRQVCYGDAERLWPLYERNRERLRTWFRWAPSVRSVGELRGAIAGWLERYHGEGKLTCLYESGGDILGLVYLTHVDRDNRRTELGYWLDAGQEGRGLVTAGCRSLIRHAFEKLKVNRIDITADVENHRSRSVAERLGFTHEAVIQQWLQFPDGRLVDVANYRLLRQDWQPEGGAEQ